LVHESFCVVDVEIYRRMYLIHGDWWVPDTTGVLTELVRTTGQYRQMPEDDVTEVAMRMAVDAAAQIH
jgi:hypothetical protein